MLTFVFLVDLISRCCKNFTLCACFCYYIVFFRGTSLERSPRGVNYHVLGEMVTVKSRKVK
jgi:hypothetical protein